MSLPRVSIVVLAWNRWDLTRRCLASVERATRLEDAEVILVDNGSEDGTLDAGKEFPWVRLLRLPENRGYVRGNNAGIEATAPESDVVLLNNDVVIEDPDWLAKLAGAAHQDESIGIAAPRLVLSDGRLIHAGTYIVSETCWGQTLGREEPDIGQYPGIRDVQGVVFAVVYIRREVLRRLGPLPDRYVSFFEDTDFCLQARAAGFRVVCTGELTVLHETGATLSERPDERLALFEASRSVFRDRWGPSLEAAYDLDLVVRTTAEERRDFGAVLLDLLIELDSMGARVVHRDQGAAGVPVPEGPWGRGHFARVFADRAIMGASVEVAFDGPAGLGPSRQRVLVPNLPIATTHFHPDARSVARIEPPTVLLARIRSDEPEQGHMLLSALRHVAGDERPVRLVVLTDPEMASREMVSLMSSRSVGSGFATVARDPFLAHEVACLLRSVDGFVSWRTDRRGEAERWNALSCGTPVLFVGDSAARDGSAPFLLSPALAAASSPLCRLREAIRWFASLSPEARSPSGDRLRSAVSARSVASVAAAIRRDALAVRSRAGGS